MPRETYKLVTEVNGELLSLWLGVAYHAYDRHLQWAGSVKCQTAHELKELILAMALRYRLGERTQAARGTAGIFCFRSYHYARLFRGEMNVFGFPLTRSKVKIIRSMGYWPRRKPKSFSGSVLDVLRRYWTAKDDDRFYGKVPPGTELFTAIELLEEVK